MARMARKYTHTHETVLKLESICAIDHLPKAKENKQMEVFNVEAWLHKPSQIFINIY